MILDRLIEIDQAATLYLNSFHTPLTDSFWIVLSDVRVWFPAYGFILLMMFLRLGWRKALIVLLSCIATVILADQISYHVKYAVERLRPCYTAAMIENGIHLPLPRKGLYGFFSGHSSNVFSFIACSLVGFRNDGEHSYNAYMWWGFVWAALVALSRVMTAMHFVGDILVGMVFGLVLGYLTGYTTRFIILKWVEKEPIEWKSFWHSALKRRKHLFHPDSA